MRVSVVVNTHNRAESLRTLLEALAAQSYADCGGGRARPVGPSGASRAGRGACRPGAGRRGAGVGRCCRRGARPASRCARRSPRAGARRGARRVRDAAGLRSAPAGRDRPRGQPRAGARGEYEALARDLRERLPAEVQEALPEPEVLDPSALEPGAKVNLRFGEKPLEGYVNVDFRALPGLAVVADVRGLPFAPGSVAELASHHLVEHFRLTHLEQVVLPHWRQLLSDDGVLRVVTLNLTVITEWFRTGRLTAQEFQAVLFGLQNYAGDDHFALYSPESLQEAVERAGFTDVEILETDHPNGNSLEIELIARPAGR